MYRFTMSPYSPSKERPHSLIASAFLFQWFVSEPGTWRSKLLICLYDLTTFGAILPPHIKCTVLHLPPGQHTPSLVGSSTVQDESSCPLLLHRGACQPESAGSRFSLLIFLFFFCFSTCRFKSFITFLRLVIPQFFFCYTYGITFRSFLQQIYFY